MSKKANILIGVAFVLLPLFAFSQARIVIHDNAYINITNDAYLVLENGNANAITTSGTGGNIKSEGENNLIKWKNIDSKTGNYTVPWTNKEDTKIPLIVDITTAGGNGGLLLSTYKTNEDNEPWPSWNSTPVSHFNSDAIGGLDAGKYAIDRFWKIDASSFDSKPTVVMSFAYDFANEGGGDNTILEADLRAQRWDPVNGIWGGELMMWGTQSGNAVIGINPSVNDFFENWVLISKETPLPVELTDFSATCNENLVTVFWTTASESNSDFFLVERSRDGVEWETIAEIPAAGNSNVLNHYSFETGANGLMYYRLRQFDYNGDNVFYGPISANCKGSSESSIHLFPNPTTGKFIVEVIHVDDDQDAVLQLTDMQGRIIEERTADLLTGTNQFHFDINELANATYTFRVITESEYKTIKVIKK